MRYALALCTVLVLAGCKSEVTVEDKSPDQRERQYAMEECAGVSTFYRVSEAPPALRLACFFAIYGR